MSKRLFAVAFAIGLIALAWVASGFAGHHPLALAMTALIAAAYLLGAWELRQFRAATAALSAALAEPAAAASLEGWLERVPAALRPAVRASVEGRGRALPGPALTPYLVGLLVMLGMLGTFLGMVVTFKGAVFALEGSGDLQAMRSALAEPIKGLGLAFGTSVAGVAASAMLGLMSALSRRERLAAARRLDACIATVLRPFSPVHQREESLKALQAQAAALPAVAAQLQALMAGLEERSRQLDAQLLERHGRLQQQTLSAHAELAQSVGSSLRESLAAGSRAAGESIAPVVASAMAQVVEESRRLHRQLGEAAQAQVQDLSRQFGDTAHGVAEQWAAALQAHERSGQAVAGQLQAALESFSRTFEQRSAALLAQVEDRLDRAQSGQAGVAREVAQGWTAALQAHERTSQAVGQRLESALAAFSDTFGRRSAELLERVDERSARTQAQQAQDEQQRLAAWTQALDTLAAGLQAHWQRAAEQALAQQQAVQQALEQSAREVAERAREQAGRSMDEAARLLQRSEALVQARLEAESRWQAQQDERMDRLAAGWQSQLQALRQEEAERGQAAVARLGELEAAVARHLAGLGAALEAPLSRLLQTAAEVPQAAAGVIAQLREEMGRMAERDNLALQERTALLAQMGTLLRSLEQAAGGQQAATDALLASAGTVLQEAGEHFGQLLQAQAGQAAEATVQLGAGALELASLGEAFGQGVQLFQGSSDRLVESLQRIEASLARSTARSDEQLAYYVAQAREVIDLSIASQQGLVESMRQLQDRAPTALALAGGEDA